MGLIVLGGAVMRHFLLRHEVGDDLNEIGWAVPIIGCALAGAMVLTEPTSTPVVSIKVTDDEALNIVTLRCTACHAAQPTDETIKQAPKGIVFASVDELKRYAAQIETQAIRNHTMPLGNKTGMTQDERDKLGAWIAARK